MLSLAVLGTTMILCSFLSVSVFRWSARAFQMVAVALAKSPRFQQLLGAGISSCCHFSTSGENLRARFTVTELAGPIWIA